MKPLADTQENTPRVDTAYLAQLSPATDWDRVAAHPSKAATAAFDCQYLLSHLQMGQLEKIFQIERCGETWQFSPAVTSRLTY